MRDLLAIYTERDEDVVARELAAVRRRGPIWRANIDASLKEIGRRP